jgi:hypothetical protein
MRIFFLAGLLLLGLPDLSPGQGPPVRIGGVRVGFRPNAVENEGQGDNWGRFKAGLWAPVYVDLAAGPKGLPLCDLVVEANDCDSLRNEYSTPIQLQADEARTFVTYVRPGDLNPWLGIRIRRAGETLLQQEAGLNVSAPSMGEFLYVTLGSRSADLPKALLEMKEKPDAADTSPRWAGYENKAELLPLKWYGYDAVDLAVLTTDNKEFLDKLLTSERKRWQAVGEWVRQGGRLLVSVSWANRDRVRDLLDAWKPGLPRLLSADPPAEYDRLAAVEAFAGVVAKRFPSFGEASVKAVKFNIGPGVELLLRQDEDPLLVRVPYGRGSVALLALDLDKGPVAGWSGRTGLWKALLSACGPKSALAVREQPALGFRGVESESSVDLGSRLQRRLDEFEMTVISFGWVALFIFLYILVVGPLDYLILKKVFRRLEWTWITFPVTVLLISVVAYFTAYAVKGNDLKINKVDLVDIDQRTELDEGQRSRAATAYGTTWWSLFSPRIQSYTLGVEPVVGGWLGGGDSPDTSVMTTWMGRADATGLGTFARPRTQRSMFRRSYEYEGNAAGLRGVPIAVWTSKAFTASWSTPLPGLAVEADLSYAPDNPDQLLGTVASRLPFGLEDAGLIYLGRWFPLEGKLDAAGAKPVAVARDPGGQSGLERWVRPMIQQNDWERPSRKFEATPVVQHICFHEAVDLEKHWLNHSYRRLDQSWRLADKDRHQYRGTREAILFARLPRNDGAADAVNAAKQTPTRLWLGELPGEGRSRPALAGTMIQDTYVRIFLPVRAAAPPKR